MQEEAAASAAPVAATPSSSEKDASSSTRAETSSSAPPLKLRSCVVCRSRKVRCDKQSPCGNCRRANIQCVVPSNDRPPRWARRLERLANNTAASNSLATQAAGPNVDKIMARLRDLENLVKELSGQLEQARAAAGSSGGSLSSATSPESFTQEYQMNPSPAAEINNVHKQLGRLVLQDATRSRYVSSGFWSRIDDELDGLKMEASGLEGDGSESSEDDAPPEKTTSMQEQGQTPSERYTFLFRHNLSTSAPELSEFYPLPSQIPFLLEMFFENVNLVVRVVHVPTVTSMFRDLRGSNVTRLAPNNEALMFSIYYAAISSMEEDEIMMNFGVSKGDLSLKYRLGLEHALAKADFLNAPDFVLVQALVLFLMLARRHESPRFVWMMTGLVIRMAQYLGLQRDGSSFEHMTPFNVEMRRRVWSAVRMLDVRASEDQGTDLAITSDTFDTRIPMNINDVDLDPTSKQMPVERQSVTDMSFARICAGFTETTKEMMALSTAHGVMSLEEQSRRLNEASVRFEQEYFQYLAESRNIAFMVAFTVARLFMAKMTLFVFLPVLFSSSSEHISDEIRTKLLIAAIEVAEYNHTLNTERAYRPWRWVYQTYTHWYAIVYLMIEITRRPWSPIVERAWAALQSRWLIPAGALTGKKLRVWIPLRKLMKKAGKHRSEEIDRLRNEPQNAAMLEIEDQKIRLPSSPEPFQIESGVDSFRERWRKLWTVQYDPRDGTQNQASTNVGDTQPAATAGVPSEFLSSGQAAISSQNPFPQVPLDWSDGRSTGTTTGSDPSVDAFLDFDLDSIDANMDLDSEVNWYDWVASARDMELDAGANGSNYLGL